MGIASSAAPLEPEIQLRGFTESLLDATRPGSIELGEESEFNELSNSDELRPLLFSGAAASACGSMSREEEQLYRYLASQSGRLPVHASDTNLLRQQPAMVALETLLRKLRRSSERCAHSGVPIYLKAVGWECKLLRVCHWTDRSGLLAEAEALDRDCKALHTYAPWLPASIEVGDSFSARIPLPTDADMPATLLAAAARNIRAADGQHSPLQELGQAPFAADRVASGHGQRQEGLVAPADASLRKLARRFVADAQTTAAINETSGVHTRRIVLAVAMLLLLKSTTSDAYSADELHISKFPVLARAFFKKLAEITQPASLWKLLTSKSLILSLDAAAIDLFLLLLTQGFQGNSTLEVLMASVATQSATTIYSLTRAVGTGASPAWVTHPTLLLLISTFQRTFRLSESPNEPTPDWQNIAFQLAHLTLTTADGVLKGCPGTSRGLIGMSPPLDVSAVVTTCVEASLIAITTLTAALSTDEPAMAVKRLRRLITFYEDSQVLGASLKLEEIVAATQALSRSYTMIDTLEATTYLASFAVNGTFVERLLSQPFARQELYQDLISGTTRGNEQSLPSLDGSRQLHQLTRTSTTGYLRSFIALLLGSGSSAPLCSPRVEFLNLLEITECNYEPAAHGTAAVAARPMLSTATAATTASSSVDTETADQSLILRPSPEGGEDIDLNASPPTISDITALMTWFLRFCFSYKWETDPEVCRVEDVHTGKLTAYCAFRASAANRPRAEILQGLQTALLQAPSQHLAVSVSIEGEMNTCRFLYWLPLSRIASRNTVDTAPNLVPLYHVFTR